MLDERKVKLMTKLALYEETYGKEDFKISSYYRKDYASLHVIYAFLSVSVGYVCLVALLLLAGVEDIMSNMSNGLILFLFLIILAGYVGVVIVYCGIASHIYNEKHKKARKRVKKYNHNLIQLLKMYEKEKRSMDNIYVIRERIEAVYGKHSKSFDKAFQFILAMITFTMINQNTGFMKSLSSPVISLGLAVVATFLPPAVMVVLATILLLAHTLAASIGIFAVSALIFLIMYIFYIRLAPKMAFVVLLTPIAFALKIPFVVPVACALIYTPVSLVPMGCGTVVYYMMEYLKKISAASKTSGSKAMLAEISTYVQKVFQNKEMWLYIVVFIIGFFIIYTIRRQELDHAWKIGIIAGAIANVVVTAMGSIALGVNTSYGPLIIGNIVAAVAGLVLELFLFSVDYARSERLQFEDDEYYYYVKAIPKVAMTTPEKTVKKINERQETEIIDAEAVKRLSQDTAEEETKAIDLEVHAGHGQKRETERKPSYGDADYRSPAQIRASQARKHSPKRGPAPKKHDMKDVDKMLLTQSLENEFHAGNRRKR